jgi:tetratricopeptide (TPR) repeat protein
MKKFLPLALLLAALPAQAAVDPFYQGLLRDGQLAFERKEYATAARALRLACFGMLDEPRPLADCLSRLALAQDGTGDTAGFRETFQRLLEVEDRFKGYSQGELPPELRAALEARLATRLPAATLAAAPAFRSTLAKKNPALASAPAAGAPAAAQPPAPVPSSAPAATAAPAVTKTAGPPAPAPANPPAPKALTDGERKQLDQARKLLGEPRPSKELRQAFELARGVADAHPDSKEAQHLAAEGAYRISRWSDAALYFRRGGDPGEEEPERLFYMAVSLYESGDAAAAAAALKRSLPNLKRTPYVESYMRKIMGAP